METFVKPKSGKTVIVGFNFSEGDLLGPPAMAEVYLKEMGWDVMKIRGHERCVCNFYVSKGNPETDLNAEADFVAITVVSRFYLTPTGKVGLQAGYASHSRRQTERGVKRLYVSPTGVCSFDRAEFIRLMTPAVRKAVEQK